MTNHSSDPPPVAAPPLTDVDIQAAIVCALTGWAPPDYQGKPNPFHNPLSAPPNPQPTSTIPSSAHGNFLFGTMNVNCKDMTNSVPVSFMTSPAYAISVVFGPRPDPGKIVEETDTLVNAAGWLRIDQVDTLRKYGDHHIYTPTMGERLSYFTTILGIFPAPLAWNQDHGRPPNEPDGAQSSMFDGVVNRQTPQIYNGPGQDDDNASYY